MALHLCWAACGYIISLTRVGGGGLRSSSMSLEREQSNPAQDARLAAALEALPQLSSLTLAACADITDRSLQARAEKPCLSAAALHGCVLQRSTLPFSGCLVRATDKLDAYEGMVIATQQQDSQEATEQQDSQEPTQQQDSQEAAQQQDSQEASQKQDSQEAYSPLHPP